MEAMTVREIVRSYLEKNGYDGLCNGLYNEDGCGCGLDDFMPCGGEADILILLRR